MKSPLTLGVCVSALLLASALVFLIFQKSKANRRKRNQEAAYRRLIQKFVNEFQSAHSHLNFEITYRVLCYEVDNESVLYEFTGDEAFCAYFAQRKQEFYGGFSLLAEYSVLEHVVIYINGEQWLEVKDFVSEQARAQ